MPAVACPHCQRQGNVPDDMVGKTVRCPGCRKAFQAVTSSPAPDPSLSVQMLRAEDPTPPKEDRRYVYQMVPIPRGVATDRKTTDEHAKAAATYLHDLVELHTKDGWEFYRVDDIPVRVLPGCLGQLFGMSPEYRSFPVLTFRKVAES